MTEPSAEAWRAADKLESEDYRKWDEDFKVTLALLLDAFAAQAAQRERSDKLDIAIELQKAVLEIARLQAPPGASAMERAKDIRQELMRIALEDGVELSLLAGHLATFASAIEQAEAEARAKAIDEAARLCDDYARDGRLDKEYACEVADEIAARIRALAKPQDSP